MSSAPAIDPRAATATVRVVAQRMHVVGMRYAEDAAAQFNERAPVVMPERTAGERYAHLSDTTQSALDTTSPGTPALGKATP